MGKKIGLVAAVGLLFLVLGGLTVWAYMQLRRGADIGLNSVPRESFAVVGVQNARLRAHPFFARLNRAARGPEQNRREYSAFTAGCGFDPWERVDAVTFAWERSSVRNATTGWEALASGRSRQPELLRCLGEIARRTTNGVILPAAPVNGHPVFSMAPGLGQTVDPATPWFALIDGAVLAAPPLQMPRALAVVDGRAPGADQNERLRGAYGALGGEPLLYAVLDVQGLNEVAPEEFNSAIGGLTRGNPLLASAGSLFAMQAAGMGLVQTPSALRWVAVGRLRTPGDAQTLATLGQQLLTLGRGSFMAELLREESQLLQQVADAQSSDPSVGVYVTPLQQAFTLVNSLYDRIRVRAEGVMVRAELELSNAEQQTLAVGAEAGIAADAAITRVRAMRNGGGVVPQVPTP